MVYVKLNIFNNVQLNMDINLLLLLEFFIYRNIIQIFDVTNVMLIEDIEEPVMFIDIIENKKHVAFFPNLIGKRLDKVC